MIKQDTMNIKAKVSPTISIKVNSNLEIERITRKYMKNLTQQVAKTNIMK